MLCVGIHEVLIARCKKRTGAEPTMNLRVTGSGTTWADGVSLRAVTSGSTATVGGPLCRTGIWSIRSGATGCRPYCRQARHHRFDRVVVAEHYRRTSPWLTLLPSLGGADFTYKPALFCASSTNMNGTAAADSGYCRKAPVWQVGCNREIAEGEPHYPRP